MTALRIAVAGPGLIGRRHIEEIRACPDTELAAIVSPRPTAEFGVPHHRTLEELFACGRPDGVVLATPNRLHVDGALECVAAGVPVLVEKPLGDTVASAARLVAAAAAAGVPIQTGHHRHHSPVMVTARKIVRSGRLGRIVAVTGTALFHKPRAYFDANGGWRREPGGGPILLNLTHDVHNLMALVGDVVRVQAVTSNAVRGFPVEDTAAVVLTFANGALGTFVVSDTAASPRSWEQTARENPDYPTHPDEDCYHLAGTAGSLSVPTLRLRTYRDERSWFVPFDTAVCPVVRSDPLANQMAHFAQVVRGEVEPTPSGRDGLRTLMVVEAIRRAAETGAAVEVGAAPTG